MALGNFSNSGLGFGLAFTLANGFSGPASQIERSMASLMGTSDAMSMRVQRSMSMMRTGAGMLITSFALLAGFVKSAKIDAQFQTAESSLQTFLGSASKAKDLMAQIRQDALDNPKFDFMSMLDANRMLISGGVDAASSESIIKNMSTILLAVGKGNTELRRMGVNLQQLAAGAFDRRDIKQFAYAGIPLEKMLEDFTGKSVASLLKTKQITVPLMRDMFAAYTQEGTKYNQALTSMLNNVEGKYYTFTENVTFMFQAIGRAIRSTTVGTLTVLNNIVSGIRSFIDTPLGGWLTRMALRATILWGAMGLLAIVVGLNTKMFTGLAGMFSLNNRLMLINTLRANGMIAAYGKMFTLGISALGRMLPLLGVLAIVGMAMGALNKGFKDFNALQTFMAEHDVSPRFRTQASFMQRLAGMFKLAGDAFTSYDQKTGNFTIEKSLWESMRAMGMEDTASALITWIARIMQTWEGFQEGVMSGLRFILAGFNTLLSFFGITAITLDRNTSSMEQWRKAGQIAGLVLAGIFGLMIARTGIMIVQQGILAIESIATAVAMTAAYWPVYGVLAAIILAVVELTDLFNNENQVGSYFDNMTSSANSFLESITGIKNFFSGESLTNWKGGKSPLEAGLAVNVPYANTWQAAINDSYYHPLGGSYDPKAGRPPQLFSRQWNNAFAKNLGMDPSKEMTVNNPMSVVLPLLEQFAKLFANRDANEKPTTINLQLDGRNIASHVIDTVRREQASNHD